MVTCYKCKQTIGEERRPQQALKCSFCEFFYHGRCQNVDEKLVNLICSGVNIIWNCDQCSDKREFFLKLLKNMEEMQCTHTQILDAVNKLSDKVSKQSDEIKMLKSINNCVNIKSSNLLSQTPKRSYSSIVDTGGTVSFPTPKRQKHSEIVEKNNSGAKKPQSVLVVKNIDGNNCAEEIQKVVKNIVNPLNDPIKSLKKTNKDKIIVVCKNEEAVKEVKQKLSKSIGDKYSVEKPKESAPKIKLIGIEQKLSDENILQCIGEQNDAEDVIKKCKVIKNEKGYKLYNVVLQCDNKEIYQKLLSKKKLYIEWSVVFVQPYINLDRCYQCQMYGHTADSCTEMDYYCPKCGQKHPIRQCKSDSLCCINCVRANATGANFNTDHFVWNNKCSVLQERMKKRMNYV